MIDWIKTLLGGKFFAWLARVLADSDNIPDEARLGALLLVLAYIFLAVWDLVALHHAFVPWSFGTGAGALVTGIGGWMYGRGKN